MTRTASDQVSISHPFSLSAVQHRADDLEARLALRSETSFRYTWPDGEYVVTTADAVAELEQRYGPNFSEDYL